MDILFDLDHFHLALDQLRTARRALVATVRSVASSLPLLSSPLYFATSQRIVWQRLRTQIGAIGSPLLYLQQIRSHLSRFPALDPFVPTLIMCGLPNVGKSSLANKITRADVTVLPLPLPIKSFFVGPFRHGDVQWQLLDSPGLLDQSFDQFRPFELQLLRTLTHLPAALLFMCDVSGSSGHSIAQQVQHFTAVKSQLAALPGILVLNKTDLLPVSELTSEDAELLTRFATDIGAKTLPISICTEAGLTDLLNSACDLVLPPASALASPPATAGRSATSSASGAASSSFP
jgi:nucleolar GTP-binding protein